MVKRIWLAIVLALILWGAGHMYLGFIKRGIIILIFGFTLAFVTDMFIPFPYSWVIVIGYAFWQIYDAYLHYKKLNVGQTQVT